MDKITIKEASFLCNIGVSKKERKEKQEILVDVELFLTKKSAKLIFLSDTVNYSEVYAVIKNIVESKEYKLIETMVENIAKVILDKFSIEKILVRIKKPSALADRNVKYVAVEIVREK